jgi:hypothetical protein
LDWGEIAEVRAYCGQKIPESGLNGVGIPGRYPIEPGVRVAVLITCGKMLLVRK